MRSLTLRSAGLATAAAAVLAGCATAPPGPPAAQEAETAVLCLRSDSVWDWKVLNNRQLLVWAGSHKRAYLVDLSMPIFNLKGEITLAFIDYNRDRQICSFGRDAIATTGMMHDSARIQQITYLSEARTLQLAGDHKPERKKGAKKPKVVDPPEGAAAEPPKT